MTIGADAPAFNDPNGNSHDIGGGGHIIAPFAGDYAVEVSAYSGTNCWYRLQVAENPAYLDPSPPPAW